MMDRVDGWETCTNGRAFIIRGEMTEELDRLNQQG